MINSLKNYLSSHQSLISDISSDNHLLKLITKAEKLISSTLTRNKKILICGNGGSAADSQHFAAELISKFNLNRKSMPAIALTTDTSILTSISNDFDFKFIFSRQLEGIGQKNDLIILISTSGKSANIVEAFKCAKKLNIKTIVLTGKSPLNIFDKSDVIIRIPSSTTSLIQEMHILILHYFCLISERKYKSR